MADDGHTINVGPVTIGEPLAKADPHQCSCRICAAARERTALVAENAAMRDLLRRALPWIDPDDLVNEDHLLTVAIREALGEPT